MKVYHKTNPVTNLGIAIGIGLLAGIAGTAAITLSQAVETAFTNRRKSATPAKAAEMVLAIEPKTKQAEIKLSEQIHWLYGSGLGALRGLIALTGVKPVYASAIHFGVIWGTELALLPALKLAPPVTQQKPEALALDGVHHVVYAVTTGITYALLSPKKLAFNS